MKISIVIPNYNGEILLKKNLPRVIEILQSYAKKNKTQVELVINDDGSKDKSREILKEFENKSYSGISIILLFNEKNYGFSTTVNRGVAKANGDIVVLLNTDVIPEDGFLEPLIKHFQNEKVFAVGCMDKSVESNGIILRGRGIGEWKRGFLTHARGEIDQTTTLWVSGGSGAFRKSIWEKLGGMNEMMNPFYWEDIDLSYRALKSGYKIYFEKESVVVHEHEEGSIKKSTTPQRVKMIAFRNQFYFVWTNISEVNLLLNHLLWLPTYFIKSLMHGDTTLLKGFFQAFVHIPQVLQRRSKVQRLMNVKDSEIFSLFYK